MKIENIVEILSDCQRLKPADLIMSELKWKYLVRSVLKGKNIILVGPTRCGKTKAAQSVAEIFAETKTEIVSDTTLSELKLDPSIKILKVEEFSDEK
jgi:type IV secretory pathway ATPase VirB11/archaellum biosynthesis ATPase